MQAILLLPTAEVLLLKDHALPALLPLRIQTMYLVEVVKRQRKRKIMRGLREARRPRVM